MSSSTEKIQVTVTDVVKVNDLVTRFKFERVDGMLMPTFSGGAHTVVEMDDDGTRRMNPYSLMSDPNDRKAYTISVRRDDQGRGGSLYMHTKVKKGMQMTIGNPVNLFSLDLRAMKHLMIAGGIGITPFMSQIAQLSSQTGKMGVGNFELHYSFRSFPLGSYAKELNQQHPNRVHLYSNDLDQQIALESLLSGQPLGTHIYICGPKGMINWVFNKAQELGWPEESVHYEEFLAPASGVPFTAQLAESKKTINVGEHQSLLEAIEASGVDAPYLCRGGVCGQCETNVLSYNGKLLHNDHWLTEEQKLTNNKIMPCVSRFEGKSLLLDR